MMGCYKGWKEAQQRHTKSIPGVTSRIPERCDRLYTARLSRPMSCEPVTERDGCCRAAGGQTVAKTRDTVSAPTPRTRAKPFKLKPQPGLSSHFLATPPLLKNNTSLDNLNTNHPPQPLSRNPESPKLSTLFISHQHIKKRDATSYVRRYPSESHSTKPISHGHPPLDEFMSIENLKTYGMSPSHPRPPFGSFPSPLPWGQAPPRVRLPRPASPTPPWHLGSTIIEAFCRGLTNHRRDRPLRRSRRRQPRRRSQTDAKLYPYSDSAYVHPSPSGRPPQHARGRRAAPQPRPATVNGTCADMTAERNGRKTLTTVQGLPKKFDQKKILKVIKKKFGMSTPHLPCSHQLRR